MPNLCCYPKTSYGGYDRDKDVRMKEVPSYYSLTDRNVWAEEIKNKFGKTEDPPYVVSSVESRLVFMIDEESKLEDSPRITARFDNATYDIRNKTVSDIRGDTFDFRFTTDDSDIDVFQPHINKLTSFFGVGKAYYHNTSLRKDKIAVTYYQKDPVKYTLTWLECAIRDYVADAKLKKKSNLKKKNPLDFVTNVKHAFDDSIKKTEKWIATKVFESFIDCSPKEWAHKISETIAHVIVRSSIDKFIDRDPPPKENPHIERVSKVKCRR